MGATTKPIVNFAAGEASKKLRGRVDTVQYASSAETVENYLVTNYGSVFRRSGSRFVARARYMNKKHRKIPFKFSASQSYDLEFGDGYIRFFRNSGSIVETAKTITGITKANPAVVTSASHGYSNGDFVDISGVSGMTQVNGKRFIVAGAAANTFTLQDEDGNNINSTSYSTYTSGGSAERVYTIASPYLEADLPDLKYTQQADVMYLTHPTRGIRKLTRLGTTSWTLATVDFTWGPFLPINTTATTITPSATTGSVTLTASTAIFNSLHVGALWKITHGATDGYVKITACTDTTHVTATVVQTLGATTATDDWNEGAWSDYRGWPTDCKFFEQRLYFIANAYKPLTVWGSVSEEYENMKTGANDDDAIVYTAGAAQVDKFLWLYPTSVLNLGTEGGPFTMSAGGSTGITATTPPSVKQQNENGATSVSPVRIGSFVYYIERNGTILGQFQYSLDSDSYITSNMTLLSDHILGEGVNYMALQNYPFNILWCVREDGVLATMTREVEQNVKGWARQIIAGTNAVVESVSVIPNGREDQVWISVKRTINGQTRRYIEYFEVVDFGDQEDAFFVDSGLTYDGTPVTTLTNLDHLEGESVQILADGAVHPNKTVTNGSVTLDRAASVVQIGLGYASTLKTMDLESGSVTGTAQNKVTHIAKVFVRLLDSLGCTVGNGTTQETIPFRTSAMNMDEPPSLFTGDKEVPFPSGHPKNKYVVVKQEQPLPTHVLGIFPKAMVSD